MKTEIERQMDLLELNECCPAVFMSCVEQLAVDMDKMR